MAFKLHPKLKVWLINLAIFIPMLFAVECVSKKMYLNLPAKHNGAYVINSALNENYSDTLKQYNKHPYFLYSNNPNFLIKGTKVNNSMGYRNPEFSIAKDSNTVRVLVLGGSTTYGFLIDSTEQTWPAILENKLNTRLNKKFEVINAGLNNATSAELLTSYVMKHNKLKPDWVIYHGGANDAGATMFPKYKSDYSHYRCSGSNYTLRRFERDILKRSWTMKLIYSGWLNGFAKVFKSEPFPIKDLDEKKVEERVNRPSNYVGFTTNISSLVKYCKADGSKIALIGSSFSSLEKQAKTRPEFGTLVPKMNIAFAKNNEILKSIAENENCINITFNTTQLNDSLYFDNCHLTPQGEEVKAELIFQRLKEDFLNN